MNGMCAALYALTPSSPQSSLSCRSAAEKHHVPKSSLNDYWNAMPQQYRSIGVESEQVIIDWLQEYEATHAGNNGNCLLTHAEETLLVNWITAAYQMNHPFSSTWIKLLARDIVKEQRGIELHGQLQRPQHYKPTICVYVSLIVLFTDVCRMCIYLCVWHHPFQVI